MRSPRVVLAALVSLLACDTQRKPDEPVDGWEVARAALLDGQSCYGETPLLCIDDETFVDSAIEAALETRWKGEMPKMRRDVEQVVRSARTKYRDSMRSPVGLEMLERVVEQRYENPAIDTTTLPGVVSVDLGALPGELRANRRGAAVVLSKTDRLEGFDWKPEEAGRMLAKYADAHPKAEEVRIEVRYPASSARHFVYRYLRKPNIVVHEELEVGRGKSQYVSNPIDGGLDTLRSGKLTLGKDEGKHCYDGRRLDSGDCRVVDRYAKARKGEKR